jgi:YidC/Oxa1 family membrane protein insertase
VLLPAGGYFAATLSQRAGSTRLTDAGNLENGRKSMNFLSSLIATAMSTDSAAETTATSAATRSVGVGNWPIVKQLAILFGFVMQGIFIVLAKMNIYSVAVYIVLFTVITRILLFPLQIMQQKSMKLQNYIQPELTALQKKYAGRRDQASMLAMQEEQRAINEKYGVSTMSGCLISFIQLPIIFALYPVIYNLSGYVPQIAEIEANNPELFTKMYQFMGLSLLNNPTFRKPLSVLIPVFAGLFQFLSSKLMMTRNDNGKKANKGDDIASSMNSMMYTMPLVSVVFCFSFPMFIGFYWVVQSVVMVIQQIVINQFMKNVTVEDLIKANLEKQNKKRAKQGLPPLNDKAKMNTRTINSSNAVANNRSARSSSASGMSAEERERKVKESTEYYGRQAAAGSITAKANMVRAYDEKKNRKK